MTIDFPEAKVSVMDKALVIMVDDVDTDLELNKRAFKRSGYKADLKCFQNGHKALDFLRSSLAKGHIPSLMILDLKMPAIGGFEMLEIMNAEALKHFPVVVLSGSSLPEDVFQAKKLGAASCYQKPFSLRESYQLFTMIAETYLSVYA